jgi:hypothetical protein
MIHHPTTLMIQDAELTGIHARGIVASLLYLLQQIKRSDQTARAESLQGACFRRSTTMPGCIMRRHSFILEEESRSGPTSK